MRPALLAVLLVSLCGCAKNPDIPSTGTGKRFLNVTLRYRGAIRTNYGSGLQGGGYYILINRTSLANDPGGPAPVVQAPFGNGFGAPAQQGSQGFVGYVSFTSDGSGQGGSEGSYNVWSSVDSSGKLLNPAQGIFQQGGQPDASTPPAGGNTLSFRLDLSRLPLNDVDHPYVQLNFVSTNNRPQNPDVADQPKTWDALGNGQLGGSINAFITLNTTQNPQLSNATAPFDAQEPTGDVREKLAQTVDEPSLDLEDWSVSITSQ